MIEQEEKDKLLKEIEKSGIVYISCIKIGIDRSTYYRWMKSDPKFKKRAKEAERYGRENLVDIAKHGLGIKLKEKDLKAIIYTLSHLDPPFKSNKKSEATILHKLAPRPLPPHTTSMEEVIDEMNRRLNGEIEEIIQKYEPLGGIPPKIDGTPIAPEEIVHYRGYIEDYYRMKQKDEIKNEKFPWEKDQKAEGIEDPRPPENP